MPSYASVGKLLGPRSESSVAALVRRLTARGYLEFTPDRRLRSGVHFFERPWAESPVKAGLPSPADEALRDALTIDEYLIERPSQTVLVMVKGDSMVGAGIHSSDIAVVERRTGPSPASWWWPPSMASSRSSIWPATRVAFSCAPPIPPMPLSARMGEFQVFGVVVGLIRKYTPRASARGITDLGITPISVKVCLTLSNMCIYSFIKDNERSCQG